MRLIGFLTLGLVAATAMAGCAKSNNSTSAQASSAESAAPPAASAAAMAPGTGSPGATVYVTNCASCHQSNGKGLTGAFPPLAGNPVVTGDPKKIIHIVKYGLTGKIMVGPDAFNGIMPPWGTQLSDAAIANVITYVRSSWGNKGAPVTAAEVNVVHK
ncbi:MAG: cytochrome c [Candidatus Tumulicola sp.]